MTRFWQIWQFLCIAFLIWCAAICVFTWARRMLKAAAEPKPPIPPPPEDDGDGHLVLRTDLHTGRYRWVKR